MTQQQFRSSLYGASKGGCVFMGFVPNKNVNSIRNMAPLLRAQHPQSHLPSSPIQTSLQELRCDDNFNHFFSSIQFCHPQ